MHFVPQSDLHLRLFSVEMACHVASTGEGGRGIIFFVGVHPRVK